MTYELIDTNVCLFPRLVSVKNTSDPGPGKSLVQYCNLVLGLRLRQSRKAKFRTKEAEKGKARDK